MTQNETWLVLSFGIMVVAVLATLYEKVERLERRLGRLEGEGDADDEKPSLPVARSLIPETVWRRNRRG